MRPLAQLPPQSVCGSVSSFQGVSSSGWFESAEGSSILLSLSCSGSQVFGSSVENYSEELTWMVWRDRKGGRDCHLWG